VIEAAKAVVLVFLVAVLQTTVFSSVELLGAVPDVLLVVLVVVALLRGPVVGACCGFLAGLVADVATLEPLGVTSLLLVLVGYWVGRYGDSVARDRRPRPYLPVVAATVLYAIAALALRAVLGDAPSARVVLVDSLFPGIVLNVAVAVPAFAVCRRIVRPRPLAERPGALGGTAAAAGAGGRAEGELVG
jgi:rod shape-determining protein MreD